MAKLGIHDPVTLILVLVGAMLAVAIAAFLIGSIPFGVVVSRAFFNSDIRAAGSGNIGAANALRTYGKAGGLAVLVLDGSKGYGATSLAHHFGDVVFLNEPTHYFLGCVAMMCAVVGHCYSPWLKFKGGKGVATLFGALFAFSPWLGAIFAAVWLGLVIPTRYASLGSVVASFAMPLAAFFLFEDRNVWTAFLLVAALIFGKHRENMKRLVEGRENKIGLSRAKA